MIGGVINKNSRIKKLICCVCGKYTHAKQWHNRDTGYGICPTCAASELKKLSAKEMAQNYGKVNIHYKIERKEYETKKENI